MRTRLSAIVFVSLLLLAFAVPVSAGHVAGEWHRLNPFTDAGTPEHERLTCTEAGAGLRCTYDKIPETGLFFDETTGMFRGHDITDRWTCPEWFDQAICEGVTAVYAGPATYFPEDGRPFTVRQEYVFTELDGQPVLYQHWVGAFACPWFETFAEATSSSPDCLAP